MDSVDGEFVGGYLLRKRANVISGVLQQRSANTGAINSTQVCSASGFLQLLFLDLWTGL